MTNKNDCENCKTVLLTVQKAIEQKILNTDHIHNGDVIEGLGQARDIIIKQRGLV